MTGKTYVNVGGTQLDGSKAAGMSREFRNAWVEYDGVIAINLNEAKIIAHGVRSQWRDWKEQQSFSWRGKMFSSDRDSADRMDGELQAARIMHQRFLDDPVTYPNDYSLSPGWKADDDTFEGPLSLSDMEELFMALRDHHLASFTASEAKAAEIDAVVDADELDTLVQGMKDEAGDEL